MAHPQSGFSSTWFLVELEFGNVGFWGEGKTGVPGEKPLEQTTEPTQATYGFDAEQESSRPHWWEASALTTAPPLLPYNRCDYLFHESRRTTLNVISPFVRPYLKNNIYEYASCIISLRETRV